MRTEPESGYTLIELLVVIVVFVAVVGIPMGFIVTSLTQSNVSSSRSAAAAQGEVGLQRLVRDLRNAAPGTTSTFTWGSTSASVSLTIPMPGTNGSSTESVSWTCSFPSGSSGSCNRSVASGAPVSEIIALTGVTFSPIDGSGNALGGASSPYSATNPAYVGITVSVLPVSQNPGGQSTRVTSDSTPITLQDGVTLLNNAI
jgi:prepilin-type N-terminal cleavage/methylation domain-containing protein